MEMIPRALALAALLGSAEGFAAEPVDPAPPPAHPAPPPSASAEEAPPADAISSQLREASDRYQRALKSYDEGNFDAALVEFRRAYELAPTFRILYNLGVVSLELRDYASALDYFERYLADGADSVSAEQRAEVQRKIRDLSAHVAKVTVLVDLPGAEIAVDDRPVGKAPLGAPLRINAGSRKISARASGRVPDVRVVELAGGDATRVELNLVSPRAELVLPPPAEAPSRPIPWLAWGGTAVLAGAAVIVGLEAVAADRDYDEKLDTPGATRKSLDDADAKATRLSVAADVLGIGALALGGYALYLTLRPAESAESASRPALELGLAPGGARLRGAF